MEDRTRKSEDLEMTLHRLRRSGKVVLNKSSKAANGSRFKKHFPMACSHMIRAFNLYVSFKPKPLIGRNPQPRAWEVALWYLPGNGGLESQQVGGHPLPYHFSENSVLTGLTKPSVDSKQIFIEVSYSVLDVLVYIILFNPQTNKPMY